jgi:hypothetical protein
MDECYEYVAVCVDDLAIALKDPHSFIDILKDPNKYHFKLKGTGPISFHLGCDFVREEDGTLVMRSTWNVWLTRISGFLRTTSTLHLRWMIYPTKSMTGSIPYTGPPKRYYHTIVRRCSEKRFDYFIMLMQASIMIGSLVAR